MFACILDLVVFHCPAPILLSLRTPISKIYQIHVCIYVRTLTDTYIYPHQ